MTIARVLLRVVCLVLVLALGTVWYGWWAIPPIAFVYGAVDDARWHRGWIAADAAMLAWAGILVAETVRGAAMGATVTRIAGVLQLPIWVFPLGTVLFAMLLAGPAAVVGAEVGDRFMPWKVRASRERRT
jgi:hypothetical protein